MACLQSVATLCEGSPFAKTVLVLPEGLSPVPSGAADRIRLLHAEELFSSTPLQFASYPGLAFRLERAEPRVLREALARTLKVHPLLAGRMHNGAVLLTNDGVPFTLVQAQAWSAPTVLEELSLLHFADIRRPAGVVAGAEPLMTVKLTMFGDGSAVLGFARSHGLMDGSSAWTFLADWARAARGEQPKGDVTDRAQVRALMPDEAGIQRLAQEVLGQPLVNTWTSYLMGQMFPLMSPFMDAMFMAGVSGLFRHRVYFSDEEVARLKAAATPATGDGWVSTQEALSAHLLLTLGRSLLKEGSKGRAVVSFFLDTRRYVGLAADATFGVGLVIANVPVLELHQRSLVDVAACIHDTMHKKIQPQKLWLTQMGAMESGLKFAAMQAMMPSPKDYDLMLQINNQSKRVLPNFGAGSGNVPAQAVVTNAGPSLMLPADGGLEVFLQNDLFRGLSRSKVQAALDRLRADLPAPTTAKAVEEAVSPSRQARGGA